MKRVVVLLAGCMAVAPCLAQVAPTEPCQERRFREFDFWVGDWEVVSPDGRKLGESSITVEERGCLLVEHWRSATGGRGQSYNFFDHTTGKWREVFVSNWGTKDYSGGLNESGQMVLEGTVGYSDGSRAHFRGVWTANQDGTVTQLLEEYNVESKSWDEWFLGTYRRKATSQEAKPDLGVDSR